MTRNIRLLRVLVPLGLIVLLGLVVTQTTRAIDADARLQSIRSRLPFISTHDFLYRREPRDHTRDKDKVAAAFQVLMELEASELRVADLVRLTAHAEPDIRVLALLGLVAQESREVIPASLRLVNDDSDTLPHQQDFRSVLPNDDVRVATHPQKVAHVARLILKQFGCPIAYGQQFGENELPKVNVQELNQWWSARKDNTDWLKWYEFLYQRASQGVRPVPETAQPGIKRFRTLIDELPVETRAWLLLYLADDVLSVDGEWHDYYASMDEMVNATNALGPEKLLSFLKDGKRQGLSDSALDETLNGQRFIERNAGHIFRKEHAPALLELNLFTAAADADPTSVRQVGIAGMAHLSSSFQSWERGRLMAALAVHGDDTDRETATKWFYSEVNSDTGSSAQSVFINAVQFRRPGNWREIVRLLVAHRDFQQLKPLDVINLAVLVQTVGNTSLLKRPIYHDDATLLRNELRRLFNVAAMQPETLRVPTAVSSQPTWSCDLPERASSLAVSEDGRQLAVGMENAKPAVCIIDTEDGSMLHRFDEPSGRAFRVQFVDDRKLVFAPGNSNLTGNLLTWTMDEAAHHAISINPERDPIHNTRPALVPSRQDGKLALVDTRTLGWFQDSKVAWRHEKRSRAPVPVAISTDARWIAINDGFRQPIELISTRDGSAQHVLKGLSTVPTRMRFSPDSKLLLALDRENRLVIWSTDTGREVTRYLGQNMAFGPLDFSFDGRSFFVTAGPGYVGSYQTTDGSPQFAIPFRVKGTPFNANGVSAVVPSRDGRHLYVLLAVATRVSKRTDWHSRIQKWIVPSVASR